MCGRWLPGYRRQERCVDRDDVVAVLRALDPRNVVDMRGQGGPEDYDTNPRI